MNKQLCISSAAVLSLTTLLMCSLVQAKTAVVYFSKFENSVSPTVDSVTQASYHPSSKLGSSAYVYGYVELHITAIMRSFYLCRVNHPIFLFN